ncbi:MAG: two-component system regulatory protein YycI [Firmicutes bacterium]|nr:two-component system regulatory protein YycI [Bacillota bacterium]
MEWGRVKSIMIGVFFVVNIFLLARYFQDTKTSFNIRSEVIENTVLILESNGININPNIIPRKMQDVRVFDIINEFETPKSAADAFWSAAKDEGVDFFNPKYVLADENSFEYHAEQYEKSRILNETDALSFSKNIIALLRLGGNIPFANTIQSNNEGYKAVFTPEFDGLKILDCYLSFEFTADAITIYGHNWLNGNITGGGMTQILPVTEVLLNFSTSELKQNISIDDITFGYYLGSRQGKIITVTAVPVWEIKTSDNYYFYYDAVNGDLLEQS